MRYHVLAADYDGTLAKDGAVDESTFQMLHKIRDSGRKIVLVTGRRLEPLLDLLPDVGLFDRIVAENGALVFDPTTREETQLAESPPAEFVDELRRRGVDPIETGRCIVAMWRPHEHVALQVISEMALELQIIFNKDAVMILPSGINKAFGLRLALHELGLSAWNTVAVGDAENDEAMLRMCGASAAVENALDPVKKIADIVTQSPRGKGVEELIADLLECDLKYLEQPEHAKKNSKRSKGVVIGTHLDGSPFLIPEFGQSILVTGGPGGGKSKFAIGMLERLAPRGVQCCIIDPEGDYSGINDSITLGNAKRAPSVDEVVNALTDPDGHCTVSLFAVEKPDRPAYFDKLYRGLSELRSRTGRPHWIIVDEAHYAAPKDWQAVEQWSEAELHGLMFITAYHDRFSKTLLKQIDWIVSIADEPENAIRQCCELLNVAPPTFLPPEDNQTHHALAWNRKLEQPIWFSRITPHTTAQRHVHSLYEGDMDDHLQFVFRGPQSQLCLSTPNLKQFISIASGVDDATWDFHKSAGDYSNWFRDVIKDTELAHEIRRVEQTPDLTPESSRKAILELIRERFEPKW
jgi:hydroxymethylpyrimidine pyrophosphatase-like HAD family hydrolase